MAFYDLQELVEGPLAAVGAALVDAVAQGEVVVAGAADSAVVVLRWRKALLSLWWKWESLCMLQRVK